MRFERLQLPESARYQISEDFMLREIAGEAVLIPVGAGAQHVNGMGVANHTFQFLWKVFQTPHTLSEAVKIAADAYEADQETLKNNICQYIQECLQFGILKESVEG